MELTILMPCLNEEETVGACIDKAAGFLQDNHISGEVLIADNASTDRTALIAQKHGARVITIAERGYGAALSAGCLAAQGMYIIMGDGDDSYDFSDLMPILDKLRDGYQLVMGNRFAGGIEKGAMPFSHRYIGNPLLSGIGRKLFHVPVGDLHCGLRGYDREAVISLDLRSKGMEYATEMPVKAMLSGYRITEVPVVLHPDGRSQKPHLRTIRDGCRHLWLMISILAEKTLGNNKE